MHGSFAIVFCIIVTSYHCCVAFRSPRPVSMGSSASKQEFDESIYFSGLVDGITVTETLVKYNDRQINVIRWTPEKPKAIVLISHGLHEHGLRYHGLAKIFNEKNYCVIAVDHAAHGLSDGTRGLIVDYRVLPLDFVSMAKAVHEEFPSSPIFVIAHSVGSLVAALSMEELPFVQALVVSGCPLFAGLASSSPFGLQCLYPLSQSDSALKLSRMMAAIAPKGPAAPIMMNELTSDLEELEFIKNDHRRYKGDIMNKTAYEVLKMIAAVKIALPTMFTPFLCLHGSNDQVASPKSSQYFVDNAGADPTSKSVYFLPSLKHEIFYEKKPDGPEAIQIAVDYIESHFVALTEVECY